MRTWFISLAYYLILVVFTFQLNAQLNTSADAEFIYHLVSTGDFRSAKYLLDQSEYSSIEGNDSLYYLRGWCLYNLKELMPSAESLLKVSSGSEYFQKSRFFSAYNYAHSGFNSEAFDILAQTTVEAGLISLKNLELAGFNLLKGDIPGFEKYYGNVKTDQFELASQSQKLKELSIEMSNHKIKSPALAGIMSGILPGSGKFYAGKRGEAVSSFISVSSFALVAAENYRKNGINDIRTLFFGTALLISYTANIYGAVASVSISETEYNENLKNTILFNLHIPLRNTFSR